MQTSVLKYVSIAIFLLILGGETMIGHSDHKGDAMTISFPKEQTYTSTQDQLMTSEEVYAMVINTFSSIRQVETFKLTSLGQEKNLIRIVANCLKVSSSPSTQIIQANNFMNFLRERHNNGSYLYILQKLII